MFIYIIICNGSRLVTSIFISKLKLSDVFDNRNGMSNVKRLGQECWLVDNAKFASGQRSCCKKRRLLIRLLICCHK